MLWKNHQHFLWPQWCLDICGQGAMPFAQDLVLQARLQGNHTCDSRYCFTGFLCFSQKIQDAENNSVIHIYIGIRVYRYIQPIVPDLIVFIYIYSIEISRCPFLSIQNVAQLSSTCFAQLDDSRMVTGVIVDAWSLGIFFQKLLAHLRHENWGAGDIYIYISLLRNSQSDPPQETWVTKEPLWISERQSQG